MRPYLRLPLIALFLGFAFAQCYAKAPGAGTSTTLTIASGGNQVSTVAAGTAVTLSVSVDAGSTAITHGQVNFCDATAAHCTDIHLLGSAQLTSAGTATMKFVPGVGVHSYSAMFAGTNTYAASGSAAVPLTVVGAGALPASTTIVATGSAGNYTLTASVTGGAPPSPTGTVSFLDSNNGNYVLGTANLGVGVSGYSLLSGATYPTGQEPGSILTADFNGDGILDIALTAMNSLGQIAPGSVVILLGKGDGTFTAAPNIATDPFPCCLVTADFNADGKPDLAIGSTDTGNITILLGNGDGTFTQGKTIVGSATPVFGLGVGDFNSDGIEDLVSINPITQRVQTFLGNGDGTFTPVALQAVAGVNPISVAVGDFNGDGKPDVAVTSFSEPGASTDGYVYILLGNGDGTFSHAPTATVGVAPEQVLAADFNGDGKLDLAVFNVGLPTTVSILMGNGDGTFSSPNAAIPVDRAIWTAVGDLNGDGKPDLAAFIEGSTPNIVALLGNGDGTFAAANGGTALVPNSGILGDFNGDGRWDVAVTGEYGNVNILLSEATGSASATVTNISPVGTGIHFADASYSGDSSYMASLSATVPLQAEPALTTLVLASNPTGTIGPGQPVALSAVLSPDAAQNHTATGNVTFYNNGSVIGSGTLANGVATASVSTLPAGTDMVKAIYAGDVNFAGSTSGVVTDSVSPAALPATHFSVSAPAAATADIATSFTVTALDTNNNAVSGYNGTVRFTSTDGSATLPADTTLSGGAGSFQMALRSLGSQTITATDTTTSSITGTSAAIAVSLLAEPVGTSSPAEQTLVTFTTAGTLGAISIVTQGLPNLDFTPAQLGTVNGAAPGCIIGANYSAGQSCIVGFSFAPTHPGTRYGGITLMSATGMPLGSAFLYATGIGPQVSFQPATITNLGGSNYVGATTCAAADGAGNVFATDVDRGQLEEIPAAGGYSTLKVIGAGFFSQTNEPSCLAIDGNGNLIVLLEDFNLIYEIYAAGGYTTIVRIGPNLTFHNPRGVAIDGNGNIFITDTVNSSIRELPASGGYNTSITLATGLSGPWNIAVDKNDNIFVAENSATRVKELIAATGYTTSQIIAPGSAFDTTGVAVDSENNVYLSGEGGTVVEATAASGYSQTSTIYTAPTYTPFGLTVDAAGNVFLAQFNAVTKVDFADPPTLNFATTAEGSTSSDSPKTLTVTNDGNAPLTFSVPGTGNNPSISSGFTLGSNSTCPLLTSTSTAATLAAGASCTDAISFQPVTSGTITGSLVTVDNTLNVSGSAQTVVLKGIATGPVTTPPTIIFTVPNQTYGVAPFSVNATSNSTGAFTYSVVSGPATIAGNVVTITGTGTVVLQASEAAAGSYSAGTQNASFTVSPATQTITFPQPSAPSYAGTSIQLLATSTSGLPIAYKVISGSATLTGSYVTYMAAGTVVLEADQPGNANYLAASAVQQTVTAVILSDLVGSSISPLQTILTFTASGTLSPTFSVLTQGAPNLDFTPAQIATTGGAISGCSGGTTYTAGQSCLAGFTFAPTRPGIRYGGITLTSTSGALLANAYIYGIGTSPQLTYSPGPETTLASGFSSLGGIAFDGSGNLFATQFHSGTITETFAAGGYTSTKTIATGFSDPVSIAVDGSGNLFIADYVNNTVSEILAAGGYTTINTIGSGFNQPSGVAVDANGNVFVADEQNQAVKEVLAADGYATIKSIGPGFNRPTGVAVDANGNLFVANYGNSTIQEILASTGYTTINNLGSGFAFPIDIKVDANDNLFIIDSGNDAYKELYAAGGYTTVKAFGPSTLSEAVALDGNGNVFVSDSFNRVVHKFDYADPPTLTFANTPVGQTSSDSPQTVTLTNSGNATLNVSTPAITSGFTLHSGSTCFPLNATIPPSPAPLAPGASCNVLVSFTPTAIGTVNGKLILTDNNFNAVPATQTIPLIGTGIGLPTSSTLTVSPNPATQGTAVTLTAAVQPSTATTSTPTGTVTFYNGTNPIGTSTLANGVAIFTISTLTAGTDTLTCTYSGDSIFTSSNCNSVSTLINAPVQVFTLTINADPSPALTPITFISKVTLNGQPDPGVAVTLTYNPGGTAPVVANLITDATGTAVYTIANGLPPGNYPFTAGISGSIDSGNLKVLPNPTTTTLIAAPNPAAQYSTVNIVATVAASAGSAAPTGSVNFMDGATLLTNLPLTSSAGTLSSATLVISTLAAGTHNLTAVYLPGTNSFLASQSTVLPLVITPSDFSLTASPPSITIETQHHATMQLTLASTGGFTGQVSITCDTTLPPYLTCEPPTAPIPLGFNATTNFNLTLDTDQLLNFVQNNAPLTPSNSLTRIALASLLPLTLIGLARRRRLRRALCLSALLCLLSASLTACGDKWPNHTPPGTYTIPITATGQPAGAAAPVSHTLNITLTVTP